ncbi:MAG: lipoyl synthase [Prolixibacteraceae bacterium]|nr:lipoyl synthase [Prolixibacteraceae bacterium]
MKDQYSRKPEWLKIKLPKGVNYLRVKEIIKTHDLNTICTSGKCPNMSECWASGTATFMILGDICTRSCKFCSTKTGKPFPPDSGEPKKIAESIKLLELKHAVITSVDRDDLEDKGAKHWYDTIREIKKVNPDTTIEVLIPDFDGRIDLINTIIKAGPDVISHNLETVKRLTPVIRSRADYETSLKVLKTISNEGKTSKSGIMVGLGETQEEVIQTMDDLLSSGCKIFTIGQYLQPTKSNFEVREYINPEIFENYKLIALEKGFKFVESSPLARTSYHAEKHIDCNAN